MRALLLRLKPGFHYPSWRPVNSASGNARPSTRPVLTGNGNRSPVNSGRYLGRSTRVVETGLESVSGFDVRACVSFTLTIAYMHGVHCLIYMYLPKLLTTIAFFVYTHTRDVCRHLSCIATVLVYYGLKKKPLKVGFFVFMVFYRYCCLFIWIMRLNHTVIISLL